MKKIVVSLLVLCLLGVIASGGYYLYHENQIRNETKKQLSDTQKKIDELPDLEKDIFAKCMDGKSGTASDIQSCEENTQKEIFTLSQDLTNLKSNLENKLR